MIKKIKKIITEKGKLDIIVVFLSLTLYSLYNFLLLCKFFPKDTFDSQLAIFWDYSSLHNLIPNKDIMYPYGLLFYYKNTLLFFSFIYVLLFPVLGISILFVLEKIIKNKVLIYIAFLSFIFFVLNYAGLEVFSRYGLLLGISVLLILVYSKRKYIPKSYTFAFGCLIGFVFSIINDVGLYAIFVFLFLSFFIPVFNSGISILKKKRYYIYQALTVTFFLTGILMGILPILFFFIKIENLATLLNNSSYLFDFPLYSKTPFLPSLRSAENLFNFSAIIITIFVLSYRRIILKEKNTLLSYIQVGIVISFFLLLQKSVIRSIDTQITFLSFLLYIFLISETMTFLKSKVRPVLLYAYFFSALFLIFYATGLRSFSVTSVYSYKLVDPNIIMGNIQSFFTHKQTLCFAQNVVRYRENKTYKDILTFINKNAQSKPIIFDYLTNPIFYVLFNQASPFYFEVYASSPLYAQQRIIKEISEINTNFVIFNTNMLRVKDNVPDYARNSILFKYILNNFKVLGKVENFIIFERANKENFDFFDGNNLDDVANFRNYLLNVDLGSIPRSEGIYKSKLVNNLPIAPFTDLYSKDKIIVFRFKKSNTTKTKVAFVTEVGRTIVEFDACKSGLQCIVDLQDIPLFYKNRSIKKIDYDTDIIGAIKVVEGIPDGIF